MDTDSKALATLATAYADAQQALERIRQCAQALWKQDYALDWIIVRGHAEQALEALGTMPRSATESELCQEEAKR